MTARRAPQWLPEPSRSQGEPREDQPRPVPHDSAGGAEGYPERADLCSIRQWHPPSERSKYSICWLQVDEENYAK
jgi:hypothetical protein